MTRTVWFMASVGVIVLALVISPLVFFQKVELVAEERLDLLATPDQAAEHIGQLAIGSRTWVVACYDIHHYVVLKVRLAGDRAGYVHKGKFRLVRPPAASAWRAPIAWWC